MSDRQKMRDILGAIKDMREAYTKLDTLLSSGPASFWFEKLEHYIDGVFQFAKFKDGDSVSLAYDIDCNDKPGWQGCKHFLKKGRSAKIDEISFGKNGFSYGITFDRETWIDLKGKQHPVDHKHQFWFRENDLEPLRGG